MADVVPFRFTWTGEVMVPDPRLHNRMAAEFQPGETVHLVRFEADTRSDKSHRHYFACIGEAFKNLPEDLVDRFPTPEHLRKWCLIKAGYRDERSIVCSSKAEARRLGAFIKPMDDYAVVTVIEAVVTVYTAKSQKYRAMGRRVFQQSKDDVLDLLAQMIDVERPVLEQQARLAA